MRHRALSMANYRTLAAAQLGVYLHGLAGDLAMESSGMTALAAGDLVSHLGEAFHRLSGA